MRLHRITLRHVRGVAGHTIDLPATGVTIVEGPNEVGKSTTAEAVDALLDVKDSSKSQSIRDLQAIDVDSGPRVEVELSIGEWRGVYTKQWGKGRTTLLRVTAPRPEQASGDEAHERVRQVLDGSVDLALWQAMRVQQGASLAPAAWQQVPALGQALDRAASRDGPAAGSGSEHEDLYARVQAEAAQFFTARTARPTGSLAVAVEAYRCAQSQVESLGAEVVEAQRDVDEAARLARELSGIGAREGELSDVLKQARESAAALDRLRDALDRSTDGRPGLVAAVSACRRDREERRRLATEVTDRTSRLAALQPDVEEARERLAAMAAQLASSIARLRTARAGRDRARRAVRAVDDERARARTRQEAAQLRTRLAALTAEQERLTAAQASLEQCRVDDAALRELETAASRVWQAERAQQLAAPTMTVLRLGEQEVNLDGAPLVSGSTVKLPVTSARCVEVPGTVEVLVRPGAGSADLDLDLDRARSDLAEQLDAAGVATVDEARAAVEKRQVARHRCDLARAAVQQLLGTDTLVALQARAAALAPLAPDGSDAQSVSATQESGAETETLLALDQSHAEASRLLEESESALDRAERAGDDVRAVLADAQQADTRHSERLANQQHEQQRLATLLLEARGQHSDDELDARVAEAERHLGELDRELAWRRAEVDAADPGAVQIALDNAEAMEQRLATERRELQSLADQVAGRLAVAEAKGLFDRWADAEAALDAGVRELSSVSRQARAARLLAHTMTTRRDAARSRYVAPYRQAVQRLGRYVFGDRFEVEVNDELRVLSRTLDGCTVPVASLSGGAREQLALVERLACAELVGTAEGVPVVIDDALGWSDPERLRRMGALLSAAGRHSQVIVLTCQPERYQHVGGATVVRLRS